jgi:hypothetical protein
MDKEKETRDKIRGKTKIMAPDALRELDKKSLSEIKDDERIELIEECFGDVLDLIKSDKIREFVRKALFKADEEFYTAPASSSGKHHPPKNNLKGGLVVHTLETLQIAKSLCGCYGIENQLLKDKIFAASILHDIKKGGEFWGDKTHPEHGPIGAFWLSKIAAIESELEEEDFFHVDRDLHDVILLVLKHMGAWNKPAPTPALKIGKVITVETLCHLIIQTADYISSRKRFSFRY